MPSAPGQNHTVGRYEAHSLAVRRNKQWHEQEISLIKAPPFLCSLAPVIQESKNNKCMHNNRAYPGFAARRSPSLWMGYCSGTSVYRDAK